MKTGEVAKMMGLNPKTITNWTDQEDLASFFTEEARRSDETTAQREYSEQDILVINTIRVHKTRQNTWKDVAKILATGHRETDLPITATLTKSISPADQIAAMMLIKAERDTALAQLQDAIFEIERMRKELREQREESSKEIIGLNRQIARLELRLEMLQEQLERDKEE
jgi:DNA-binding transcriptional MerR regulator